MPKDISIFRKPLDIFSNLWHEKFMIENISRKFLKVLETRDL